MEAWISHVLSPGSVVSATSVDTMDDSYGSSEFNASVMRHSDEECVGAVSSMSFDAMDDS